MLWKTKQQFHPWDFDKEAELETVIAEVQQDLFGESRLYLDVKKLIGQPGKTQNIPDGYLIDLSSRNKPVLYLVEVELAEHDPLRHVAQQLLNFSLSFKSTSPVGKTHTGLTCDAGTKSKNRNYPLKP